MSSKLLRSLIAFSLVASSFAAVKVAYAADSYGKVVPSASTLNGGISAQDVPTWSNTNIIAVDTGYEGSCAIQGSSPSATSGVLFCWGKASMLGTGTTENSNVPVAVTAADGFTNLAVTSVTVGSDHACAIEDGKIWCWGGNFVNGFYGVLGTGGVNSLTPKAVSTSSVAGFDNDGASGDAVTAVDASYAFTCAIEGVEVYCWGNNSNSNLGLGANAPSLVNRPMRVVDTATPGFQAASATAVQVGFYHACALASGVAYCWGLNNDGRLGNTTPASGLPTAVATGDFTGSNSDLTAIGLGNYFSCGVQGGKLRCWGAGTYNQLGTGNTNNAATPTNVSAAGNFTNNGLVTSVSGGEKHTCAIQSGVLYCWGKNADGQLGLGNTTDSSTALPVSASDVSGFLNNGNVTSVSANSAQTCAIESRVVYCWGNPMDGRLGLGQVYGFQTKPVKVFVTSAPAAPTISVSAGQSGTLNVSVTKPSDGGSTILSYEYSVNDGLPTSVTSNGYNSESLSVTGLTNGTLYSIKVRAVNAIGAGAWSAPSSGTPTGGGGGGIGGGGGGIGGGGGGIGGGGGGNTPCVAGAPSSTNSDVTFDSAFAGDGGYDFSDQLSSSTFGKAAAGPDGSLYVAVSDGSANINSPTNSSTRVVRFPANGTPSTWGSASVDLNSSTDYTESAAGLLVLSDGSVVVMIRGMSSGGGGTPTSDYKLAKFTSSGVLDTTFGTNGLATIVTGASTSVNFSALAEGPAGSIYVSKSTQTMGGQGMSTTYAIIKFASSGSIDSAFATGGELTVTSWAMATDSTGALYVGGRTSSSPANAKIVKYTASGVVDTTFGVSGEVELNTSAASSAESPGGLAFANGKISGTVYVSSFANNTMSYVTSAFRMSTAGVLDTTFDTDGIASVGTLGSSPREITVLSDGGLILPISTFNLMTYQMSTELVGVLANGTPVTSLVSSPAKISSGTCVLSGGVVATSAGIFAAGTSGSMTISSHIFKIAISGMAAGAGSGSDSGSEGGSTTTSTSVPSSSTTSSTSVPSSSTTSSTSVPSSSTTSSTSVPSSSTTSTPGSTTSTPGSTTTTPGSTTTTTTPGSSTTSPGSSTTQAPGSSTTSTSTNSGGVSNLVTSANVATLERAPGSQAVIVNGQEVVIESITVSLPASRTPESQRTPTQVASVQQAGAAFLQQFLASLPAGATSNVVVVNTPTGAVVENLVFDANGNSVDVPVEDIVFLDGPQLSLLIGSNNANITADGKYQVAAGGIVGVTGAGLGFGTNGEIVAMSTPTLLASFQTNATGEFNKSAKLPSSIGVGDHTLVVAVGSTYATMGIRVLPAALPSTGSSGERMLIIALFTLVFGALFFRGRRFIQL